LLKNMKNCRQIKEIVNKKLHKDNNIRNDGKEAMYCTTEGRKGRTIMKK
jgi:hypothetical protein